METTSSREAQVEQLVSDHLYLIQHIVHELAARYPRHIDRQDLWSAGAMGLVEAAKRYEPEGDVPFGHYARRRIRGAMIDSTRQRDWATRGVRRDQRELDTTATELEQANQRSATDGEVAARLGIDEEEVVRRRAAAHRSTVLHLDQPVGDDGDGVTSLADLIPDANADGSPEGSLERRELLGAVRTAVRFLSDNQREVVERYYLKGDRLRDIGDDLGVTEARVSQLRAEAVTALQAYLTTSELVAAPLDRDAPGKRERAAFVARVSDGISWRQRLEAADAQTWTPSLAVNA